MSTQTTGVPVRGTIGASAERPDGTLKVQGRFAYASDLGAKGMLWGVTVRSPHPHAHVRDVDIAAAVATPGVHAVLTHADVPGRKTYGMEIADTPVLCFDRVRFVGDPVAIVAGDHPETARLAAARVEVDYELLDAVTSCEAAMAPDAPLLHERGNVLRHVPIRHGAQGLEAEVVVRGEYEVGMQDQAFLGPESGLAVPDGEGGVDLYVATQWLHVDLWQALASLDLPADKVRFHLAGVGGAFGGREDVSIQIHACLLALHTGRPVKMMYGRDESFVGHVHRHPARMRYEHGATREGRLVYVRAQLYLDGGAYASSSTAVISNAASFCTGPYRVPSATVDAYVTYTNNPPCGAMRGFGAVQAAFACEAQMDRLAAAVGVDPVDLRIMNALGEGDPLITGQVIDGPMPTRELLERLRAMPMPPVGEIGDLRALPGGAANVTHGEGVRRGVGYAVGVKNIGFSEGFDDFSTARVRVAASGGSAHVDVHTAAAEVGQGLVTLLAQIARTELGIEDVRILDSDTTVGSGGSTSASRQSWMTGGAVKLACEAVRVRLADLGGGRYDPALVAALVADEPVEETRENHHRQTFPHDPETGQADAHVALAFAAHRAVVDVDTELGLVRVVEVATTQDVGRIMNPLQCEGQIEGGIAQGLGLALMEEIVVLHGRIRNASFTDYLIPTTLDMPPVRMLLLEHPQPDAPYGLNGVGEPPTIASTAAIAAALRAATGRALVRVPVAPDELVGL